MSSTSDSFSLVSFLLKEQLFLLYYVSCPEENINLCMYWIFEGSLHYQSVNLILYELSGVLLTSQNLIDESVDMES